MRMVGNTKEHTILITDDEVSNLDILSSFLSPMYNLLLAENGQRALELAREHLPDLILLDVLMPEMSGFEVIAKLKESEITDKIPVIFITGLSGAEDEERGFFLGAVDYIAKPLHKSRVKARVNNHIQIIDHMRTIERIALIDTLTKIPNRRGFEKRLNAAWCKALLEQTPVSILLLDVDNFKDYNDSYGHQQGDAALKAVADSSLQALRRHDDFAARCGGEEFVFLLPGAHIEGALEVAERVRKHIEMTVIPTEGGATSKITVSIGVNSVIPNADSTITDFIHKADRALYNAKKSGRNKSVTIE